MARIQNVAKADISTEDHMKSDKSILISILDPASTPPTYWHGFIEVKVFEFLDLDEEDDFSITEAQAEEIADLLKHCLTSDIDVVVHCTAGICRSGAVAEAGRRLGFEFLRNGVMGVDCWESPNSRVLRLVTQALGINLSAETSTFVKKEGGQNAND